jgi:hypothetical protein
MHELIVKPGGVIVVRGKSEVALLEIEDAKWPPGSDNHPLSDIKFLVQDNERVLNVLLDNPDMILSWLRLGRCY